jgi:hypothetical protein
LKLVNPVGGKAAHPDQREDQEVYHAKTGTQATKWPLHAQWGRSGRTYLFKDELKKKRTGN